MHLTPKSVRFSVIFMTLVWLITPSLAQNTPLEDICQGFLSSSGAPVPGNAKILCDCLVREVQYNLTVPEMRAYQSSVDARQPLPKALEAKVMAVATSCLTQAQ